MSIHFQYGFVSEPKEKTKPILKQVHSNNILEVRDAIHLEALRLAPSSSDAVFTYKSRLELAIFAADCIPILFYSEDHNGPVGAIHCGWRGARSRIVEKVTLLHSQWNLHFIFGPSNLGCCYEVREDLVHSFESSNYPIKAHLIHKDSMTFLDLPSLVIATQLTKIPPDRIHLNNQRCTACSYPSLPSFRKNQSTDPHIRAWIRKVL